MKDSINY